MFQYFLSTAHITFKVMQASREILTVDGWICAWQQCLLLQVEVLFDDQVLGKEHSLEFLSRTRWRLKKVSYVCVIMQTCDVCFEVSLRQISLF